MMRLFVVLLFAGVAVAISPTVLVAVQNPKQGDRVRVSEHANAPTPFHRVQGIEVTRTSVRELTRFRAPVLVPPVLQPIPRPGFAWRWHRNYGWLSLPIAVAGAEVLLPETFVVPQSVVQYEAVTTPSVQTVCPYCGRQIIVHLP